MRTGYGYLLWLVALLVLLLPLWHEYASLRVGRFVERGGTLVKGLKAKVYQEL